jgi:hypothetical protein
MCKTGLSSLFLLFTMHQGLAVLPKGVLIFAKGS